MSKPKIPKYFERNDACELFKVLLANVRYSTGSDDYDPAVSVGAAMILLQRLGLAVQITQDEDKDEEGDWVLTVDGNERLAQLLKDLRQWDPNAEAKKARRRRLEKASSSANEEVEG